MYFRLVSHKFSELPINLRLRPAGADHFEAFIGQATQVLPPGFHLAYLTPKD